MQKRIRKFFLDCLILMYKCDTFFQNVKNHSPNNKLSHLHRLESAGTPNLVTF